MFIEGLLHKTIIYQIDLYEDLGKMKLMVQQGRN